MFKSLSLPAILQFSKFVIDDIEPFLQFFLTRRPASSISTPQIKNVDFKHHDMLYTPRSIGDKVVSKKVNENLPIKSQKYLVM